MDIMTMSFDGAPKSYFHNLYRRYNIKGYKHHFVLQEDNGRSHGYTLSHRSNTLQYCIIREANIYTI
jgi:hypothetical protein